MRDTWRFWAKMGLVALMTMGMVMLQQAINWYVDVPRANDQLMAAAASNDPFRFEQAIRRGASPLAEDENGSPALCYAVQTGSVRMARCLLDHGADINAADAYQMTPLMWAVDRKSLDMVQLLCQRGAIVSTRDHRGLTALDQADQSDCREICDFLRGVERTQVCEIR